VEVTIRHSTSQPKPRVECSRSESALKRAFPKPQVISLTLLKNARNIIMAWKERHKTTDRAEKHAEHQKPRKHIFLWQTDSTLFLLVVRSDQLHSPQQLRYHQRRQRRDCIA